MDGYFLDRAEGEVADLGPVRMRLVVPASATGGTISVGEFRGAEGPWTVPHVHRHAEESFYVLDGRFTFTIGDREVDAEQGSFVLVPRDMRHVFRAGPGGGALLVVWTPGGNEQMFLELGRLPAGGLTDPAVRAEIGARFDSVPV